MDRRAIKVFIHTHHLIIALGVALLIALYPPQSTAAAVTERKHDIVFGFPEFAPLSFTNERGEPDGYLVHLSDALFDRANMRAHAVIYPAQRLFENLANGSIDFSMVVHNPALDACCFFSSQAVVREDLRVYHANGKLPIHNKDDLIGKRIITIRGYSYAGMIAFINDEKNHIVNEVAPSHEAAFMMLNADRADYLLDYAGPASNALVVHPVKNMSFDVIDYLDIYLVLSKSYPDAEHVLVRLTRMVKNMQHEPEFRPPENS